MSLRTNQHMSDLLTLPFKYFLRAPPSFNESLHLLSLGGNRIHVIPESIGSLTQLQALNLCDNFIEKIPSSVARLHNLKTLSLHKNGIKTLPRELISLQNLTEVKLVVGIF